MTASTGRGGPAQALASRTEPWHRRRGLPAEPPQTGGFPSSMDMRGWSIRSMKLDFTGRIPRAEGAGGAEKPPRQR